MDNWIVILAKWLSALLMFVYGFTCAGRFFKGQQIHSAQLWLFGIGTVSFLMLCALTKGGL